MPRKIEIGDHFTLEAEVINARDAGNIALKVHGRVIWMPALALIGPDPEPVAEVVEAPKPKNGRRTKAVQTTEPTGPAEEVQAP